MQAREERRETCDLTSDRNLTRIIFLRRGQIDGWKDDTNIASDQWGTRDISASLFRPIQTVKFLLTQVATLKNTPIILSVINHHNESGLPC